VVNESSYQKPRLYGWCEDVGELDTPGLDILAGCCEDGNEASENSISFLDQLSDYDIPKMSRPFYIREWNRDLLQGNVSVFDQKNWVKFGFQGNLCPDK
jgi:hypothetical protein